MSTAAGLRGLVQDVRGRVRGHDLPLCAAGVTFYATLGVVPLLLLALFLSGQVAGEGTVRRLAGGLTRLLPDDLGAQDAARFLAVSGTSMSWLDPALLLVGLSAFLVGWLTITPVLVFAYRALSPERPCTRSLLWGGAGTGSFLSGTCLGFVLFLSLGLDLGGAYGGSLGLSTAAAAVGWLFVLHFVVLLGFVTTLALDERGGHPLGARRTPAPEPQPVSAG